MHRLSSRLTPLVLGLLVAPAALGQTGTPAAAPPPPSPSSTAAPEAPALEQPPSTEPTTGSVASADPPAGEPAQAEAVSDPAPAELDARVPVSPAPVSPAPTSSAPTSSAPTGAKEKKEPEIRFKGKAGEGLTVEVGDRFSLNVRSRIQVRYQYHLSQPNSADVRSEDQVVNIGTARLWFSGKVLLPELSYMIQLAVADRDYRDGAKSPIYDAYLEWAAHRDVNLRVGQYFVPFDRLRTVREWALQMGDRPRPVAELTLDRDVGVLYFSDHFLGDESPLAVRAGVFGGGGINLSNGKEPGALFLGRVELRPLGPIDDDKEGDLERRKMPALAVGGGVAANVNTNRQRSTTGMTYVGGTTDYLHAAADLVFKWRGVALQAEYLWKQAAADTIESIDAAGDPLTEYTRSGQGWVLQASYTFDPPFEVVGRLSGLYAFDGTDPAYIAEVEGRGQEIAGGVNYYFNGHKCKLQGDYIARMPHDFDISVAEHTAHVQLDVTF